MWQPNHSPYLASKITFTNPSDAPEPEVDAATNKLLQALGYDPLSLDQLADRAGLDIVTATKMAVDLELNGVIKKITGGNFVRANP